MGKLAGKYALITGGARGIGAAIARKYLQEGAAAVALLDYDAEQVRAQAQALDETGARVMAVPCDVANAEQVKDAVAQVCAAFSRIDILVNNAGIIRDAMLHKMTQAQWDQVLAVNLTGTMHVTQCVLPLMRAQEAGSIISIASIVASGNAGQANYAASKAGMIGFSKTIALEGARKQIRANTISPGCIQTEILDAVPEESLQTLIAKIPMGRLGRVEEVASLAAFLGSDESAFITGQDIVISGGGTV